MQPFRGWVFESCAVLEGATKEALTLLFFPDQGASGNESIK